MTPIPAPINCATKYDSNLLTDIFSDFKKKKPKVTEGLKCPPVKGAHITIAKYKLKLIKISWNGLSTFTCKGGIY